MKNNYGFLKIFRYSLLIIMLLPFPLKSQVVAVKAKKIYTVTQGVIENGVILIRDGKIESVGADLEIPWNAKVLDYSQKIVVPGLVEAHAARGYDVPNETNPLTPFVSVLDNLDASHDAFQLALRFGVTTLNIMPGHNTLLGGKGAVVKPVGLVVEDMLLVPCSGMKVSVVGTVAQTRMGVMAQLRRYFNETQDYIKKKETEASKKKEKKMVSTPLGFRSPEYVKYEDVADLFQGRFKAFVYGQSPSDVMRAQKLSEKYGYQSIYVIGPECYKAADLIAKKKLNIILDPELFYFEKNPVTGVVKKVDVIKAFLGKSIEFALQSDPSMVQSRNLFYQAMRAMSSGLSSEDALKAITLWPAQMLGIEGLVGSIDKGKLANLLILDQDPFQLSTKIEFVYIEGNLAYDREKDEELKKLMDEKFVR